MGKKELMTAPTLSRKEELFEQFLQLLFEHCKEQHVVTFYAEKLFITPQYLSLILKELTGKSANKWIDDVDRRGQDAVEGPASHGSASSGYTPLLRSIHFR